jgi:hypothetical protein
MKVESYKKVEYQPSTERAQFVEMENLNQYNAKSLKKVTTNQDGRWLRITDFALAVLKMHAIGECLSKKTCFINECSTLHKNDQPSRRFLNVNTLTKVETVLAKTSKYGVENVLNVLIDLLKQKKGMKRFIGIKLTLREH